MLSAAFFVGATAEAAPHRTAAVTVIPGTSDYGPGPLRVSFLLIGAQGAPVYRSNVLVSIEGPFGVNSPLRVSAKAALEPVGVPGSGDAPGDITRLYVVHLSAVPAGKYVLNVAAADRKSVV